jgi:tRNA A-37 threonylcarbamoyl transferase component Bud32
MYMALLCPSCQINLDDVDETAPTVFCPRCQSEFETATTDIKIATATSKGSTPKLAKDRAGLRPGDVLGNVKIERTIGVGGMGKVYLAKQQNMNRQVAVKVLPQKYARNEHIRERFLQEIRTTAQLEHPNIVTIYEAGEHDGTWYLTMAYVEGQSLDRILERDDSPFPEAEALRIAIEVAKALEYAWQKKRILHRDIKPANIMRSPNEQIRILDLGVAKQVESDANITRKGIAIGTPQYMSPEQAQGSSDMDFRTDVYSLGTTLWHLLSGECPFDDTSVMVVLTKVVNEDLPPIGTINKDVSKHTARLVEKMTAKDRSDRHASWKDVRVDIERVLRGLPITEDMASEDALSSGGKNRRWQLVGLLLLAIVMLLLVIFSASRNAPRSQGPGFDMRWAASTIIGEKTELEKQVAAMRQEQRTKTDEFAKARLQLKIGETYYIAGKHMDAVEAYREAVVSWGTLRDGFIGGSALFAIADCYERLNDPERRLVAFEDILSRRYYGPGKDLGLKAATILVDHYRDADDPKRFKYLTLIINEFPGDFGNAGAAASFELVEYLEANDRILDAAKVFQLVRRKFAGKEREHERKSIQGLKRLKLAHPGMFAAASGDLSDIFTDYIFFSGKSVASVRNNALNGSGGITIETWLFREKNQMEEQYILSRFANNQRGFNIYLSLGQVHFDIFDGTNGYGLQTKEMLPARKWTHIAASVGSSGMKIFINGQLVAERSDGAIANDGAGRLHLGRKAWVPEGFFVGRLQNAAIYRGEMYSENFEPATKPTNLPTDKVLFYVISRDGELREFRKSHIDFDRGLESE